MNTQETDVALGIWRYYFAAQNKQAALQELKRRAAAHVPFLMPQAIYDAVVAIVAAYPKDGMLWIECSGRHDGQFELKLDPSSDHLVVETPESPQAAPRHATDG